MGLIWLESSGDVLEMWAAPGRIGSDGGVPFCSSLSLSYFFFDTPYFGVGWANLGNPASAGGAGLLFMKWDLIPRDFCFHLPFIFLGLDGWVG